MIKFLDFLGRRLIRVRGLLLFLFAILGVAARAQTSLVPTWSAQAWGTTSSGSASYSNDGKKILVWDIYGFEVYDLTIGAPVLQNTLTDTFAGPVESAIFSSDGTQVIYSTYAGAIYSVNISTNAQKQLPTQLVVNNPVRNLAASKDGKYLLFAVTDQTTGNDRICLVNATTSATVAQFDYAVGATQSLSFVNSTDIVATGSGMYVYSLAGKNVFSADTGNILADKVAISPDGGTIYDYQQQFGSSSIVAIDSTTFKTLWSNPPPMDGSMAISSDGKALYFFNTEVDSEFSPIGWIVQGLNTATGKVLSSSTKISTTDTYVAYGLVSSPSSPQLLAGIGANHVAVLQVSSSTGAGSQTGTLFQGSVSETASNGTPNALGLFTAGTATVGSATVPVISTDENVIAASGSFSSTQVQMTIRNALTGEVLGSLPRTDAVLDPTSKYYATATGTLSVYAGSSNDILGSIAGPYGPLTWGGSNIASASNGQASTYSFNGSSIEPLKTILWGDQDYTVQTSLSPDGKYIALLDTQGAGVELCNAVTGAIIGTVKPSTQGGIVNVFQGNGVLGVQSLSTLKYGDSADANAMTLYSVSTSGLTRLTTVQYDPGADLVANNFACWDGAVSPDGVYVALAHVSPGNATDPRWTSSIRVYKTSNGAAVSRWDNQFVPDLGFGYQVFRFSSDDSVLIWPSNGGIIAGPVAGHSSAPVSALSGITLSPTSVVGGVSSTGTVKLTGAAPSGGLKVNLTSNSADAEVPASVTVPSGATSETFTVTTSATSAKVTATIGASAGTVTKSATLTVNPSSLTSVALSPTSVVGGATSTGTVTLNGPAPSSGWKVTLTSSSSDAKVPESVTVASGAKTATFSVTTVATAASTTAKISAGLNSVTESATLTVAPSSLASLALSPTSVVGGSSSTGTVTLTGPAPAGGWKVTLSSGAAEAKVPASVTVASGTKSATFTVTTSAVSANTSAAIIGKLNAVSKSATLTIDASSLSSVAVAPTSVTGGTSSTGTVTLTGPAPTGGWKVTLTSSSTAAKVPASVTVASGAKTATFTVTTSVVTANMSATITAKLNSVSKTAVLTVKPSVLSSLTVSPSSFVGGSSTSVTGKVVFSGAVPSAGVTVTLSSSNTNTLTVPASVKIAGGANSATFTVKSKKVSSVQTVTVKATSGSVVLSTQVKVNP